MSKAIPLPSSADYDLLLVVGGYNGTNLAEVELATLDPFNKPVPPCLGDLNDFPIGIYASAGAVDEVGNPFICGGVHLWDSRRLEVFNRCYKYDPQSDSWEQPGGSMPFPAGFIADTEVPGLGLVMVGGRGGAVSGDVIATKDGGTFQKLADIPDFAGTRSGRHISEACLHVPLLIEK